MTFEDHIFSAAKLPDLGPLRARYIWLCAQLLASIAHPAGALTLSRQLRKHVRQMIQVSQAHFRIRRKTEMLLRPDWRERVISDLGGWKRLKSWTYRQEALMVLRPDKIFKPIRHPAVNAEEAARRARMRKLMKANIHPRILRDPCRMDFEGCFRLPPQKRLKNPINEHPQYYDYDYDFDARPRADFSGIKTPIVVWPEEFRAAAQVRSLEVEETRPLAAVDTGPKSSLLRCIQYRKRLRLIPPMAIDNSFFGKVESRPPQDTEDKPESDDRAAYSSRAPPAYAAPQRAVLCQAPLGGALSHIQNSNLPDFTIPCMRHS